MANRSTDQVSEMGTTEKIRAVRMGGHWRRRRLRDRCRRWERWGSGERRLASGTDDERPPAARVVFLPFSFLFAAWEARPVADVGDVPEGLAVEEESEEGE